MQRGLPGGSLTRSATSSGRGSTASSWGKQLGRHMRDGWEIRWFVSEPQWQACRIVTRTWKDMMAVIRIGPQRAAELHAKALASAAEAFGMSGPMVCVGPF